MDVVFFQAPTEHLVVAEENQAAIRGIQTTVTNCALVIEHEGGTVTAGGGNVYVSGSGNRVAGRDVHINGKKMSGQASAAHGRTVVGIALPITPTFLLVDSGDATLYNIQQDVLELGIQGSGDISAFGQVDSLNAKVSGSGDVEASELMARTGNLFVAGSGDIDAHITKVVSAHVAGSGDIVVRGNPATREHSVTGSGDVKFKRQ